jgi:hypothetical protein
MSFSVFGMAGAIAALVLFLANSNYGQLFGVRGALKVAIATRCTFAVVRSHLEVMGSFGESIIEHRQSM